MTLHHPTESTQDPTRRRALAGAISVLALTLLPGCGNLTAGGFGEARVVANGDAPDTTSPTAAVLAAAPARTDHEDDEDDEVEAEGELDLVFRLYLESDDGIPLDLSSNDLEVDLDLEGTLEPEVVTARIPSGVYTSLRVVFREVEIEIEDGMINGVPIAGEVEIEIEDLTVERPINVTVLEGSTVEILLDLNATTWLQWLDTSTQPYSVRTEDFADAFSVRIS